MKNFIFIIAATLLLFSAESYSQKRHISLSSIYIQTLTRSIHIDSLPLLSKGVKEYMVKSIDLKNSYGYSPQNKEEIEKNRIRVYILRYNPEQDIWFRVTKLSTRNERNTFIDLGYKRRTKKISPIEKEIRENLVRYFQREGNMSEKEAQQYMYYAVIIAEGIDKVIAKL